MIVPDPSIRRTLRDALIKIQPADDPTSIRNALYAVACHIAAARNLPLDGLSSSDIPAGFQATLDNIDWAAADVSLLGNLYTELLTARHAQGSYYTPRHLADQVVKWTLGLVDWGTVCDLSMGSGHLLMAASAHLAGSDADSAARWQALQCCYGADTDPITVELARLTLWLWAAHPSTSPDDLASHLIYADSLRDVLWVSMPTFDAVIGNPPFASVFTRAARFDSLQDVSEEYETVSGSYDLAVPFVERAVRLTKLGGRCGLVLPNKILAADYAAPLRRWLSENAIVERIADYADTGVFEAGVYPIVCVFRHDPPVSTDALIAYTKHDEKVRAQSDLLNIPGDVWSPLLDPDFKRLSACWQGNSRPLGETAHIAAGLTVPEAYDLRDAVIDSPPSYLPTGFVPLVTTGLITRHRITWGAARAQFLKRTFRRPVIAAHALPTRRADQVRQPKILVAGMGLTPRAALDRGELLASVGALIIYESLWPLGALCAWLNSDLVAKLYRALFGGLALSGGYLRFGKRELARLPLPDVALTDPRLARLDVLGWEAASGPIMEAEINSLVASFYSLGEEK